MRFNEFNLQESRGVAARQPGETYVSNADSKDILTIQSIDVLPNNAPAFETLEDLESALSQSIPDSNARINDNNPNNSSKAAIVATVTDVNNKPQYWVRYLKAIPDAGVMGAWKTLRGYKYGKGAKDESVPIKPSDLITDDNYRNAKQISAEVMSGIKKLVSGTEYEGLTDVMSQAINLASTGKIAPIKGAAPYFNVLQKYGGEYLGPLALISGGFTGGDTLKMLQAFELPNLKNSKVSFPQDTTMELIDSIIRTPSGQDIGVSSKISKGGGAASSLSGIAKQITPEMESKFKQGTSIIKTFAEESAIEGPLQIAQMFKLIDSKDADALRALPKSSKNIKDLKSPRLRKLTAAQGVAPGTLERNDYRVLFHALTAIVNQLVPLVNANNQFKQAMLAALNNNNYVQILTKGNMSGDDVTLDYYTKFPAVFKGAPQLVNKTYFATGQKGRIGFKMK